MEIRATYIHLDKMIDRKSHWKSYSRESKYLQLNDRDNRGDNNGYVPESVKIKHDGINICILPITAVAP